MALITLGLAWVVGLLAGILIDVPLPTLGLFILATAAVVPLLRRAGWSIPLALAGLFLLLGVLRVELFPGPSLIPAPLGEVALSVTVTSGP